MTFFTVSGKESSPRLGLIKNKNNHGVTVLCLFFFNYLWNSKKKYKIFAIVIPYIKSFCFVFKTSKKNLMNQTVNPELLIQGKTYHPTTIEQIERYTYFIYDILGYCIVITQHDSDDYVARAMKKGGSFEEYYHTTNLSLSNGWHLSIPLKMDELAEDIETVLDEKDSPLMSNIMLLIDKLMKS